MDQNQVSSVHYFLRAVILSGFAIYIVSLVKNDHLLYYISPRMENFTKGSAMACFAISIQQIFVGVRSLWGKADTCDCEHPHSRSLCKNAIVYSMFLLPLCFGFLLPDANHGSISDEKPIPLPTPASERSAKIYEHEQQSQLNQPNPTNDRKNR